MLVFAAIFPLETQILRLYRADAIVVLRIIHRHTYRCTVRRSVCDGAPC